MKIKLLLLFAVLSHMCTTCGVGDEIDDLFWTSGESGSGYAGAENLTLSCAAEGIQEKVVSPYSEPFSITLRVLQGIFYASVSITGSFLNILVIVLVAKNRQLQNISFLVTLQVVCLDLILSITCLFGFVNIVANRWLFGEGLCTTVSLLIYIATTQRSLLMFAFVIDRFLSVFWTYYYPMHKAKINITLSGVSWAVSIIIGIMLTSPILDCYRFNEASWVCSISVTCNNACSIFVLVFSLTILVPSTVLPVVLYAALYYKSRKITKSTNVATAGEMALKDLHQRERKATITFFLLFLTVLLVTAPGTIASIIISTAYSDHTPPPGVYIVILVSAQCILLLLVSDPIILMRNADMREVIAKVRESLIQKWQRHHSSMIINN